jgi:hypothetical protein
MGLIQALGYEVRKPSVGYPAYRTRITTREIPIMILSEAPPG